MDLEELLNKYDDQEAEIEVSYCGKSDIKTYGASCDKCCLDFCKACCDEN